MTACAADNLQLEFCMENKTHNLTYFIAKYYRAGSPHVHRKYPAIFLLVSLDFCFATSIKAPTDWSIDTKGSFSKIFFYISF